ncbi:cytochrome c biogenesis heme-transporting ATPase CcmA [Porticoccaceae bacterium]|nr:cytochrome c biogenesis heme-transporting ATPase CcmA [Porticoccaceae bacterium]MDB2382702.1 cytochrome c biogenesis heme-transporting ATPase CcmA [Porticoccaceae bacterium]MDB2620410.1 cytochrome c biogenesis heme-transporting ATPase CcmA [Porticoccaceae bacterium]MDB2669081.1 cytochrome c biogenesis heme-transporting ATPase CcmA [Porticoccaceae bacterium]MDC0524330.1 cytochrome c biogenesis heme-transporting ATPase CcmA [Porticoccaceae bacterium]
MVNSSLLTVNDLRFERDDIAVINDACLTLDDGEIMQIEGPNGSGKTTLLRILTTALQPSGGEILYQGQILSECRFDYLSNILFLGHQSALKLTLTAEENLSWITSELPGSVSVLNALERVGLRGYSDIPCHSLSAGQQRRVALARLLLSNAKIWFLDEPFAALDGQGVQFVEQCMERHVNGGGAVMLTTHQPIGMESVRRYSLVDSSDGEALDA